MRNEASSVVLFGGDGRDDLTGGAGSDALFGLGGRDRLAGRAGDDALVGDRGRDLLLGGSGVDDLNGGPARDRLLGGAGADRLDGGSGGDLLVGGAGIDALAGGGGRDLFLYAGLSLDDASTPAPVPDVDGTGVTVRNSADDLSDFALGRDRLAIDLEAFGVGAPVTLAVGITAELGDANLIVQTDAFGNAGLAARAIADNPDVTADEGFFVYFNATLGFSRLAYSADLGDGGDVTVLANLRNQDGPEGLAAIGGFGLDDFSFI